MAVSARCAVETSRLAAFLQGLQEFGWTIGRNAQIDIRWTGGSSDHIRKSALELGTLARRLSWRLAVRSWAAHTWPRRGAAPRDDTSDPRNAYPRLPFVVVGEGVAP